MSLSRTLKKKIELLFQNKFFADEFILDEILNKHILIEFEYDFPEVKIFRTDTTNTIDSDITDSRLYLKDIPNILELITILQESSFKPNELDLYNNLGSDVVYYPENLSVEVLNRYLEITDKNIIKPVLLSDATHGDYIRIDDSVYGIVAKTKRNITSVDTVQPYMHNAFRHYTMYKVYEFVLGLQSRFLSEERINMLDRIITSADSTVTSGTDTTAEQDIKRLQLGGLEIEFDTSSRSDFYKRVDTAYKGLMGLKEKDDDFYIERMNYYKKKFMIEKLRYFKQMNY